MTDAEGRLSMPASQIVRQERTDRQGWRFALSDMGVFLSADETDSSVLKLSFERVRRGLLKEQLQKLTAGQCTLRTLSFVTAD